MICYHVLPPATTYCYIPPCTTYTPAAPQVAGNASPPITSEAANTHQSNNQKNQKDMPHVTKLGTSWCTKWCKRSYTKNGTKLHLLPSRPQEHAPWNVYVCIYIIYIHYFIYTLGMAPHTVTVESDPYSESPIQNTMILVVTITGCGPYSIYMCVYMHLESTMFLYVSFNLVWTQPVAFIF